MEIMGQLDEAKGCLPPLESERWLTALTLMIVVSTALWAQEPVTCSGESLSDTVVRLALCGALDYDGLHVVPSRGASEAGHSGGFFHFAADSPRTIRALADSGADFREALVDFFSIDTPGAAHRMQAARLLGVWKEARTGNTDQQQVEAAGPALARNLRRLAGGCCFLTWSQNSQERDAGPVQDGLLGAETLSQVVSLDAEERCISGTTRPGDGITWRCCSTGQRYVQRNVSPALRQLTDFEGFRMNDVMFVHVWGMLAIKTSGRPIVTGLTDGTLDEHMKWLMSARTLKLELDMSQRVVRNPPSGFCMTYEFYAV